MNDLEWYLEVGGKQSGPHTAKEIVELVRAGRIPPTAQVTAARMSGDWVSAQDLVDAYNELYAKSTAPMPIPMPVEEIAPYAASPIEPIAPSPIATGSQAPGTPPAPVVRPAAPLSAGGNSSFQAPPRPTEELERSKIIDLSKLSEPAAPDPTDALFQAIQAVREKNTQKVAPPAPAGAARDTWGDSRPARIPPQLLLIVALAAIFGITAYGVYLFVGKKAEKVEVAKKPSAATVPDNRPAAIAPSAGGARLLGEGGVAGGAGGARPPSRPVAPLPRAYPPARGGFGHALEREEDRGGGARYRDDQDPPIEMTAPDSSEGVAPEESDLPPTEQVPPMPTAPADPSQIAPDRIIPESGGAPTGFPPNEPPVQ